MPSFAESAQPFVCAGTAACFASFAIHPIDLAKVRLQLFSTLNPGVPKPNFMNIIFTLVKEEGVKAAYAGLSASLMRQAIYGTARIGLHDTFSVSLKEKYQGSVPFYMKTLSGMLSGAIAVCIGTPFDVSLVRMQADSMKPAEERRNYKNVFDALARIYQTEGMKNLYAGLAPNILRGMAMNVGMLACNDQAKELVSKYITEDNPNKPKFSTQVLSAAIAGFSAAFLSLPFDMLKSRLQDMKPTKTGKMPYSGLTDCAIQIFKREGVTAFWTGFGAYYGRCAPHAMIILLVKEQVTNVYKATFVTPFSKTKTIS